MGGLPAAECPLTPDLHAHGAQEAQAKLDAFMEGFKVRVEDTGAAEPGAFLGPADVMCAEVRKAIRAGSLQLNALLPDAEYEGKPGGALPVFVALMHHGALKKKALPLKQMLKLGADPNIRFTCRTRTSMSGPLVTRRVTPLTYVMQLREILKEDFLNGSSTSLEDINTQVDDLVAAMRFLMIAGADANAVAEELGPQAGESA